MSSSRTLVLVRHAQAEAFASTDVDRVLTGRGRADARALGQWLRSAGISPDAAIVSSATRARQTWQLVAEAAGWDVEPVVDEMLYGAEEDGVLEIVGETPDDTGTVVVVGHNPTLSMLAQLLDDGEGEPSDLSGLPTGTAAVFEIGCSWRDIEPMCARLRLHHVGRGELGETG